MKTLRVKNEIKTHIVITHTPEIEIKKYLGKKNILVCDKNTYGLVKLSFDGVIFLKESSKDAYTLERVLKGFFKNKVDRDTRIFCLSGGALSDLVGFACGIWMRGIDYVIVPTTLLSQIDASIGGKTAVDWFGIRNMLGSFHFPWAVIINPSFSLKQEYTSYRQAFGEIFKYIIIMKKDESDKLLSLLQGVVKRDLDAIEKVVKLCIDFKKKIVEADPFDRSGIRVILNFGHTPAHAIESIYNIPHGDAVLYGCIFELMLSKELGYISTQQLKRFIEISSLLRRRIDIDEKGFSRFIKVISYDKKNTSSNAFLVRTPDGVKLVRDVEDAILKKIWRSLCREEFL